MMMRSKMGMTILMVSMLMGCTTIPEGLKPVEDFDIESYLGKWYEIARLDHKFERNMSNVSATYTVNDSGHIKVVNRGYKMNTGEWKSIEGVARFAGDKHLGSLEVSFFGPFYGGYHIIDLDQQKNGHAMVVGPTRSYFWILSRNKNMDEALYDELVKKAAAYGIDTKKFIRVEQNLPEG